jgi:hypothetical protein
MFVARVEVIRDAAQGIRRRHQPRRPPQAKIRPGNPAPAIGPGTTFIAPNSPSFSPLKPSVKKRVSGFPPLGPPVPKPRNQRPPFVLSMPTLVGIVPMKLPFESKTSMSLAIVLKLKLPTSRSFANGPKLAGARVMPHGEARGPPTAAIRRKFPF